MTEYGKIIYLYYTKSKSRLQEELKDAACNLCCSGGCGMVQ